MLRVCAIDNKTLSVCSPGTGCECVCMCGLTCLSLYGQVGVSVPICACKPADLDEDDNREESVLMGDAEENRNESNGINKSK